MDSWTTTREPEKPKTIKGRNELLRARAKEQSARLVKVRQALVYLNTQTQLAGQLYDIATLLDELAEALKP